MTNPKMDESSQLPMAIKPVYETVTVNQSIVLYTGQFEIVQDATSVTGEGVVSLEWQPTPQIRFYATGIPVSARLQLGEIRIHIPNGQPVVRALLSSLELAGQSGVMHWHRKISGSIRTLQVGKGSTICACLFHLPNFHDYLGTWVLETQDWVITIDGAPSADQTFHRSLRSLAGYGITHIGKIQKVNGAAFRYDDARELLGYLAYFLSFCRGNWVAPLLPVGIDSDGNRQWEEWREWPVGRWENIQTWFNLFSNTCVSNPFAGCLRRLRSDTWGEAVRLSIWWYISCNTRAGGLEGSLVLSQAAFELLSWTHLVEDSKVLSKRGFEDLPASDKLRLLLSNAKIQLAIPDTLTELQKLSKSSSWQDGPHALTEMRNGLVHPGPKKRRIVLDADPIAVFEAWSLSLWYLELLLLWIFEYEGDYSNRLKRCVYRGEEVERVPWTKSNPI